MSLASMPLTDLVASKDCSRLPNPQARIGGTGSILETLISKTIEQGGLENDEARRVSWPVLLGVDADSAKLDPSLSWGDLPEHPDEHQVSLDVDRALNYSHLDQTDERFLLQRRLLNELIVSVLRKHPKLCYFQGYHDIAQVILLVLGPDLAHDALARLSLVRIRDFMLPSLGPAIAQLNLLKPLLRRVDPKIYQRLKLIESHFALAAVLTLYSHDIDEYAAIVRLFDVFLAKEAVFPIYLFASIILGSRELILDLPEDEPEMLHVTLSKLPKPTDLEDTIRQACVLLQSHPPQSLSTWRQISSYSTLRTCRLPLDWTLIRLQEAERLLALQHEEFNRQVRDQKLTRQLVQYRRLVIFAGLTVVIGLVAVWVGPEGLRTRMKALWVYF